MKAKEFRICKGSNKLAIFLILIVCITIGLTLPANAEEESNKQSFPEHTAIS